MARTITELKVFLASPSDVAEERKIVADAIAGLNETVAPEFGFFYRLIRWEEMMLGFGKRTQEVILAQSNILSADIFIGILWNRFGTTTEKAPYGTKEEFDVAYAQWLKTTTPRIMLYFCQRPSTFCNTDELAQKSSVINFIASIKSRGLYKEYISPDDFGTLIQKDLILFLLARSATSSERATALVGEAASVPDPTLPTKNMIRIPAGLFYFGRSNTECRIESEFYIDDASVTNAEYAKFIEDTGYMSHQFRQENTGSYRGIVKAAKNIRTIR